VLAQTMSTVGHDDVVPESRPAEAMAAFLATRSPEQAQAYRERKGAQEQQQQQQQQEEHLPPNPLPKGKGSKRRQACQGWGDENTAGGQQSC